MKNLILLFFIVLGAYSHAQDDDILSLLSKEIPSCKKLNYNAMKQIPALYKKGKVDSALLVFNTWDASCPNYYVLSYKVLLAIESDSLNNLNDVLSDMDFLNWFSGYHSLSKRSDASEQDVNRYTAPSNFYGNRSSGSQPEKGFWELIAKRAAMQVTRLQEGTWPYVMAKFLAFDQTPLLKEIKSDENGVPPALRKAYSQQLELEKNSFRVGAAVYADFWVPQENLANLGNHPGIGISLGGSNNMWRLKGSFHVNFLKSANTYSIRSDDSIITTDNFVGFFAGVQVGRNLFHSSTSEWSVNAGVAYRSIQVLPNTAPEEEEDNAVFLGASDVHFGSEYRYFYNTRSYIGIEAMYHLNYFVNNIDNQFDGNSFSVKLIWGFSDRADGSLGYRNLGIR